MKSPEITIIEKVLDNEATQEEVKLVTRWFKTKEGIDWLSHRMDRDEQEITLGHEDEWVDHEIPSVVMYHEIMKQLHYQKIRRIIFQVAAILIPIVLFLGLFIQVNQQIDLFANDSDIQEIYVPKGEKLHVIFQDGSSVNLNADSRIRFPKKFAYNSRNVQLDGEGYFEIEKNSNRPFNIGLDKLNIKVLGTTFNVKAYSEDNLICVALHSGLVELSSDDFKSFNLNPGEQAMYDKTTHTCKITKPQKMNDTNAWKEDKLVFKHASLDDVIKTLSRTYNVTFTVRDQEVNKYTYTITLKGKNLKTSLKELEMIVPVHFIQTKDTIYVYKK